MSQFEIVAREDFSDVTYLLQVRHPLMARAAKPGQFVIVMAHEHGERIPLTIADFDAKAGTITLVIRRWARPRARCSKRARRGARFTRWPDGRAEPDQAAEKGPVRRWWAGRCPDVSAGARLSGGGRVRDRRPRLPHQEPDLLGRQVPQRLRRLHSLHGRRLRRREGSCRRGHRGGPRASSRHRGVRRDRPPGDDEGGGRCAELEATVAAPTPASPAPAAEVAPSAATRAAEPASDEAYIETPRCTSCNECINLDGKVFGYDENKQARIVNLEAATYATVVEAAENCQVAIIHPGKPRNPDEPVSKRCSSARSRFCDLAGRP